MTDLSSGFCDFGPNALLSISDILAEYQCINIFVFHLTILELASQVARRRDVLEKNEYTEKSLSQANSS